MMKIECPACRAIFEDKNDSKDRIICPYCRHNFYPWQQTIDSIQTTENQEPSSSSSSPPSSITQAHNILWVAAGLAALVSLFARNVVGVVVPLVILGSMAVSIKKGGSGRIWLSILFPFVLLFSGLGGLNMLAGPPIPEMPDEVAAFRPVLGFLMLIYFGLYTWALVLVWLKPSNDWVRTAKEARKRMVGS